MVEKCIACKGTGTVNEKPCEECGGKGKIKIEYDILKLIGRYRVLAHYDVGTNDFPRTYNGNFNPTFGDFYLKCPHKSEIKDAFDGQLMAYIPSIGRGRNIRNALVEKYGEDIIYDYEETDGEILFFFSIKDIDKISTFMKPTKSGVKIKPFSVKNLPKGAYTIPQCDLDGYNATISAIPTRTMNNKGRQIIMPDGVIIKKLLSEFDTVIHKIKGKKYIVEAERRLVGLKPKEFIHSLGMWDRFLEYLKVEVKVYSKK